MGGGGNQILDVAKAAATHLPLMETWASYAAM